MMGKNVGIWLRVSTEDQVKGESPEHHERRARLYAESKSWTVREVYRLDAVSGKSVMDHPETQRMLESIRSGTITGLIFSKLARLARNTKELLEFAEIFREQSADLISLQESIDTSTPAGRLFYTMIAAMAQWEREEIADRVKASVVVRAKMGKSLGSAGIYGYRWKENKLVIDPAEAAVRKLMFELFLKHKRKKTVARLLNQAGYRTRAGAKFTDSSVRRLITDPTAKGMRRANYSYRFGKHGEKYALKPTSEWIFTPVEPIVTEELWNECNRILEEQRLTNRRPAKRAAHLFSGIAYCICGGKMYVPSNTPKYVCSKCRTKLGIQDLEEIYQSQLKSFVFSDSEIREHFEKATTAQREKAALVETLTAERSRILAEMDRILRLCHEGEIPEQGFGRFYHPLDERLKQIDQSIPELQAEIDYHKIQHLSDDEVLHEARDLYSRWSHLTPEEKRQIVETITDRVVIDKHDISIHLSYSPLLVRKNGDRWAADPKRSATWFVA